jgi:hypothetical protein
MSKGDITIVVNVADQAAIEEVTTGANPIITVVGELVEFSFQDIEVDLSKNVDLSGLNAALETLGEDDYAYTVIVERLETLDTYGHPKKFGLDAHMTLPGYTVTNH